MLEWTVVASARSSDGSEFVLARHDDDWVVRVGERLLMSDRMHDSEIALAEHSLSRVDEPRAVLVGGLGLGYTLRAVLDGVGPRTVVTVVELVPEIVEWNRKYLAARHEYPLDDPRCRVVVGDVFDTIQRSRRAFDVILLDVDNGPRALAQARNQRLYGSSGVRSCYEALAPGGVLTVWSAGPNGRFAKKLQELGFQVEVLRVSARTGSHAKHVLFIGTRP